jgi:hypothetical protein
MVMSRLVDGRTDEIVGSTPTGPQATNFLLIDELVVAVQGRDQSAVRRSLNPRHERVHTLIVQFSDDSRANKDPLGGESARNPEQPGRS